MSHVVIIGGSGIAAGLRQFYLEAGWHVSVLSRQPATVQTANPNCHWYSYQPGSVLQAQDPELQTQLAQIFQQPPDVIFCCIGALHGDALVAEKNIRQLSADSLQAAFTCNTILPALWLQQLWPWLKQSPQVRLCWLSAKVGSISDNHSGGWYSYRASKAALNMLIKSMAIELRRTQPQACLISLHPGTTDTALSLPFQRNLPSGQLQNPAQTAARLAGVAAALIPAQSGALLNWDGTVLPF